MILIPKAPNQFSLPIWDQQNNSDFNGTLYASFNIDTTENEGKLRLGKRLLLNWGTADDSNMTSYPAGFAAVPGTSGIFTVAGSYVWKSSATYPSSTFARITGGGVPTNCDSTLSDILYASNSNSNALYVTANSTSVYYSTDGGTNWSSQVIGAAGNPKMLTQFQDRIYMTSGGNTVLSWVNPASPAVLGAAYTITLGANETITTLRSSSNRIWITTINSYGKGYVHEWDGTSTSVTKSYRLEALGALACVIKDDIPFIIDSNASFLAWNGGTFKKLDSLRRKNNKVLFNSTNTVNNRFIHPNGMSIVDGKINFFIDGRNADSNTPPTVEETIPSGLWEYDENKGLTHKHSIAQTKSGGTIADFGQGRISGAGALAEANYYSTAAARNGKFLCGATYYSDASSTTSGIFYDDSNDTLQKAGYFITTKLQATDENGGPSVQNTWATVYTMYRKLLDSADEIVVKYRVFEQDLVEGTITWVNSTSFTVADSSVDVDDYWTSGTGGEVEIVNGVGGGKCSHITNAVLAAGTWTVTVDETYTGATGTARARFQNWKKLGPITFNNSMASGVTYDQSGMGDLTNWVQFKVWMLFTGKDEIERMVVINNNSNPAN